MDCDSLISLLLYMHPYSYLTSKIKWKKLISAANTQIRKVSIHEDRIDVV
jgi:hypothetical protein